MLSFRWRAEAHINELELRAFLSALCWRLRRVSAMGCRYLHLLDSQVSIAVIVKGRSASVRLNRVQRKIGMLLLASGSRPFLGFCRSHTNPSDKPSRQFFPRRKVKRKHAAR